MYDAILVPVDGSDPSDAAVDHAASIADRFDATVHTLHVVDIPHESVSTGPEMVMSSVVESLHERGQQLVEDATERLGDAGVEAEGTVMEGVPRQVIREYVQEHDVDLVVMGTHGRSGVKRYLLGSTTERVVRTVSAPVLTVEPEGVGEQGSDGAAEAETTGETDGKRASATSGEGASDTTGEGASETSGEGADAED